MATTLSRTEGSAESAAERAASLVPKHRYTVEQYLSFERGSDSKHEYFNGGIYAMVGASRRHVLIASHIATSLTNQLLDRPCEVYPNDMRLKVSETGLYTYPDVMVCCGEPQFHDSKTDTLLNPQIVIEVLSDSTEDYDRGGKFEHYQTVDSLRDYVLFSQHAYHAEHHARQPDGRWLLTQADGLASSVVLTSIGCELQLGFIYRRIKFEG